MPLPVIAIPFFGTLGGLLVAVTGAIVARVIASLGISFAFYYGVSEALEFLRDTITRSLSYLPQDAVNLLSMLQVGRGLTILFSCLFANMVVNGVTSGSAFKRMIFS